ncbi:hypothetical protein [Streptomyces sp. NPDC059862]|uniref:hypothetical protein n=1 Tax=unclassified Streptomyces TaxID=2593676 RepID=UPI00362E3CE0
MKTRTVALATSAIGVAALTLTGMTYASATGSSQSAPQAAPAHAPYGGDSGKKEEDKGYDKKDHGDDKHHDKGKVIVNGQKYPAHKYQCFPVTSVQIPNGDGPVADDTFNVENLSKKIVEFFDTANCSNTPEAILPPKSSQFVVDGNVEGDVIVGSFKVIDSHHDKGYDDEDHDEDKDY